MSDVGDRRARKKARTRESIRTVAQQMFTERGFEAVTIAEIAAASGVAVQTVFNHFATKEEIFFEGRATWLDGPAESVRQRDADVLPSTALRRYLVATVGDVVRSFTCAERRSYTATLQASPALRERERELIHETEVRLTVALLEAWSDGDGTGGEPPATLKTAAAVTAAMWLSTGRALVVSQRPLLEAGADPLRTADAIEVLAEQLFSRMERELDVLHVTSITRSTVTGWPAPSRRAG